MKKILDGLKCISVGQEIVLGQTDGTKTIATAKDVFKGGVDSDFMNESLNVPGLPKPETELMVFKMIKCNMFRNIFLDLDDDLDRVCAQQDQIIQVVVKYPAWLQPKNNGTLILLKDSEGNTDDDYSVVWITKTNLGLRVRRHDLSSRIVWDAIHEIYVIAPQIK